MEAFIFCNNYLVYFCILWWRW